VINGGGVTVNSITYNNPTNITVNLNVAGGASAGARTVTVTNPDGQSATSAGGILTITGAGTNSAPILAAIANKTINELSTLTFTNTATDPNGDSLTFSLDPGAPTNATINPLTGVFAWTPTEAQGPATNSITVRVTDSGSPQLSDTKTFSVTVNEVNLAPTLSPISDRIIYASTTVIVTNVASDPDLPANTLTFSLDPGAPVSAGIDPATGILSWTPDNSFTGTTNTITVRVTDNGIPPMADTKSFNIIVAPPPVIVSATLSNDIITLTWTAIAGKSYRVQYRTNLIEPGWTDLAGDVVAGGNTASKSDSILSAAQKFYRVHALP
jgi:hypothetical protein